MALLVIVKCSKHPKYDAIKPPSGRFVTQKCQACLNIYNRIHPKKGMNSYKDGSTTQYRQILP